MKRRERRDSGINMCDRITVPKWKEFYEDQTGLLKIPVGRWVPHHFPDYQELQSCFPLRRERRSFQYQMSLTNCCSFIALFDQPVQLRDWCKYSVLFFSSLVARHLAIPARCCNTIGLIRFISPSDWGCECTLTLCQALRSHNLGPISMVIYKNIIKQGDTQSYSGISMRFVPMICNRHAHGLPASRFTTLDW